MNYDELTKTSLHIVQDYGLTGIFKDQKQNLVKQHAPAKQWFNLLYDRSNSGVASIHQQNQFVDIDS